MTGVQVKETLVELGRVCPTEKDIRGVAKLFAQSYLQEFRSVDLIVFAKKLTVFAEELRATCEENAYSQAYGEKDFQVAGCKVDVTNPQPVYTYSEKYQVMELEVKEEIDRLNKKLKATRDLEQANGTAEIKDYKKGVIRITIPKGDK